jgi:NIL domain
MTNISGITQTHIKILIPEKYHQEPIISRLVSDYQLTVTIKAAVLGANGAGGGWFDLNLTGLPVDVDRALAYFRDLKLDTWSGEQGQENW